MERVSNWFTSLIESVGVTIAILIVFAIMSFGVLSINYIIYPTYLALQRESVENSKSYINSRNDALFTYYTEYNKLETKIAESGENQNLINTYKSQQTAIYDSMCHMVNAMDRNNVSSLINQFLVNNGECR